MIETGTRPGTSRTRIRRPRPRVLWPLVAVMAWLSLGGFAGGIPMVRDPTGAMIGADPSWLKDTPLSDFFLPGMFLVVVYGVGVLLLIVGLIWNVSPGPLEWLDRRTGRRWAWLGTVGVGAVLVVWILYEFVVLPTVSWLMPAMLVAGALMVALPMTPAMRRFYAVPATGIAESTSPRGRLTASGGEA